MSDWLEGLPHQIPFRAVSRLRGGESVSALFQVSAGDSARFLSIELWVLEAMAETAGAAVFEKGTEGRLAGVDRFRIDGEIEAGDQLELKPGASTSLGELYRVEMTVFRDGAQLGSAVLYLTAPSSEEEV